MNTLLTAILLITGFLTSCTSKDSQKKIEPYKDTTPILVAPKNSDAVKNESYFKFEKDSITVLPFEIAISLSPKAKGKIISSKETIVVSVTLTGAPKDKKLISEDGEFYVASSEKEIRYGQVANFHDIKFPRKIYDQLIDKDVIVNIFFFSGRRSSNDNLLDGNMLSDKISNVVTKKFELKGKLIYGDD